MKNTKTKIMMICMLIFIIVILSGNAFASYNYVNDSPDYHIVEQIDDDEYSPTYGMVINYWNEPHSMGSPTYNPSATCTTTGTKKTKCSKCPRTVTESYGPLGHNWGSWTQTLAPTCTTAGSKTRTCKRSGCGQTQTASINALGHSWESTWSYDEEVTGYHWYDCTRCDATKDKDHHADSDENGYCDDCGLQMYILIDAPTIGERTFTYNGQNQSPVLNGYDSTTMSLSGNVQKNVGNYIVQVSLGNPSKYKWRDMTTEPVSFNWSIGVKDVYVTWDEETTFEADGTPKICGGTCPSGITGETINLSIVTAQTNVGSYTATASINTVTGGSKNNYRINNNTHLFEIIDTTRPTITATQNFSTWTNQNVIFTVTATDAGSGIKQIEYSMDQSTWRKDFDQGTITSTGTKTFNTAQNSTIYFRAIDNKDNISQVIGPYKIQIDKTNPSFTAIKNPDRDWTNDKVVVTISANDNIGVNEIKVNGTALTNAVSHGTQNGLSINKEGTFNVTANGTTTILITDVAGNQYEGTVIVSNIDKTKPTVTIPAEIDKNEQIITASDSVAPNSKMKYIGVSRSGAAEPQVFGTGTSTRGNEYDYYYQVANNAEVTFTFTFNGEGIYYIFARDLAGNYTKVSTVLEYKDISGDDFEVELDFGAGNPQNYTYDGTAHEPKSTITDTETDKVLVENVDYTKSVTNNINAGTATITYTGIGIYKGTRKATFTINPRTLNIVPKSGQSKFVGVDDPEFEFTFNNEVYGEIPRFTGGLSRTPDTETAGTYEITAGNLALENNVASNFLKGNYSLQVQTGVTFEITDLDSFTTTWTIPAGATIKLPIPGYATNSFIVSWGDGKIDKYTMEGFPTHTYTNTTPKDYTIRIAGSVNQFGYVEEIKPTSSNIYNDYVTFNSYLKKIEKFGNINAKRLGFSYCENLTGPLPERSGFEGLVSVANMFNECKNLTGEIPEEFFKDLNITSAKNVFKNCEKLTGSLDASIFDGDNKIKSFASAYDGCIGLTGTIPEGMFETNTQVTTFAKVFANTNISGAIPEGLFSTNTKVSTFSEAFSNCPNLTSIPENLFDTNTYATNYYRTFYNCTSIESIPTNLFTNNVVAKISNEASSHRDYRGTFENCSGITGTIDLDSYFLGKEMFKNCTGITKIKLPNVVEIGDEAFYGCNSLIHIKIVKDNFSAIGTHAFYYSGANPPLVTYINSDSILLYSYNWEGDNRELDVVPPTGTVKILSDSYPFTKTENIQLRITVTDDKTPTPDCFYAVLNDTEARDFKPEEIESYRDADRQAIVEAIQNGEEIPESVFTLFRWVKFEEDESKIIDWTLSNGEGIKTVYVYFMDDSGNISQVTQDLELVQ